MSPLKGLVGALGVLAVPLALACGVCVEDRVAATYDHAVVARALAAHDVVVYAGIDGARPAADLARAARSAARAVPGVDRGTVRTAAEPAAAISFAIDPAKQTPEGALAEIQRKTSLRLTLLRVAR